MTVEWFPYRERMRRRIVFRAIRRRSIDAARVAAHDETWAAAAIQIEPRWAEYRRRHAGRFDRLIDLLQSFLAEYWDEILQILLALLPLILEKEATDG